MLKKKEKKKDCCLPYMLSMNSGQDIRFCLDNLLTELNRQDDKMGVIFSPAGIS